MRWGKKGRNWSSGVGGNLLGFSDVEARRAMGRMTSNIGIGEAGGICGPSTLLTAGGGKKCGMYWGTRTGIRYSAEISKIKTLRIMSLEMKQGD